MPNAVKSRVVFIGSPPSKGSPCSWCPSVLRSSMSSALVCDSCGDGVVASAAEAELWITMARHGEPVEGDPVSGGRHFCSLRCAAAWTARALDGDVMEPPPYLVQTERPTLALPERVGSGRSADEPAPSAEGFSPWRRAGAPGVGRTADEIRRTPVVPPAPPAGDVVSTNGHKDPSVVTAPESGVEPPAPRLSELVAGVRPAVDLRSLDTSRARDRRRRR